MNCTHKHCTFTCNIKQVVYVIKINFEVLITPWCKALLEMVIVAEIFRNFLLSVSSEGTLLFIQDYKSSAIFNVPFDVELLESHPIPKLKFNFLSTVWDCMLNIFAATVHIWRSFPQFVSWERAWPLWHGTHAMWKKNYVEFKVRMFLRCVVLCGTFFDFGYWRKTLRKNSDESFHGKKLNRNKIYIKFNP